MKPQNQRIGQHFRKLKAKTPKPAKDGMHVIELPPQVAEIYRQMHKPRFTGQRVSIRCPYCRTLNIEGLPICCDDFRAAIVTIRDTAAVPVMVN